MRIRVQRVKESTAIILVNGQPAGTGFAVTENIIATNFHVVQQSSPATGGQTQITYARNIEVRLYDGRQLPATPHPSVLGTNLSARIGRDVTLLSVPANNLRPLKLGRFADVSEGDRVYLAGYPLGIAQIVVATGMLSTKWQADAYLGQGGPRNVAWLDVTMNKGNSGGPVLLLTEDPARDVVVGIANFILNPFAQKAEEFVNIAANFPGNAVIIGVNFKKFSILMGAALMSQSHGVGGCVAIDYVQLPTP
ncbi:MAG: serine protease [Syntrophorhabdaceae bacterium]|nr:serine protease [Syntrophorhabdaceae bacterium]